MKKQLSFLATVLLVALNCSGCTSPQDATETLVIYNWQDYIFEGDEEFASTVEQFEDAYGVNVEYYTFETNENMLNVLKTGKSQYDLVCPSDYVIQKMIIEDMVEPLDKESINNYIQNASPYIQDIFNSNTITKADGSVVNWSDYSVPYFWGTMGFMYDPEVIEKEEDIATWDVLWNPEYKGLSTLKDSVRDTYCAGVLHAYSHNAFDHTLFNNPHITQDVTLLELSDMYDNNSISEKEYTAAIQVIMNDTSKETIELVKNDLKEAKENVYGFEVDSGKADIVTGKISINFCWSGDAVYAMDCAEEESDMYLNYALPKEGSNVWFDGWVMPKGANTDLAQKFLNFISRPDIAALNMNEVGYTSSIAGQDIFDMMIDWYGADVEDLNEQEIASKVENEELYAYDLSYFFGETIDSDGIIYAEEINRQFSAQYPSKEEIIRCAVMEDFGDSNEAVLNMWTQVKANSVPVWAWIFIIVIIVLIGVGVAYKYADKRIRNARIKQEKTSK